MSTVLLVEDDPFLAELMGISVTFAKHKLITASSAEAALPIISAQHPDVILLDIILPGMSGLELLAIIKKDPSLSNIPVIIISNLSDDGHIAESKKLGAADYLIKSNLRPSEIIDKANAILHSKSVHPTRASS